jgi:hypothetical protein
MPNTTVQRFDTKTGRYLPVRYIDNGDGTFSESIITEGSVEITDGDVEVTGTVVVSSGSVVVSGNVGGHISFPSAIEFTRENNATPYSAGDVISSSAASPVLLEIPLAVQKLGGTAYVVGCEIVFNVKSVIPRLRVHMFNSSNPTIAGDNLQYKELYADRNKYLGYFDMDAMFTAPDTANSDLSRAVRNNLREPIKAAAGTQSIWILLQTLDAVTLTAESKVSIALSLDDN